MFDKKSRYFSCQDAILLLPNSHTVSYKARRFIPKTQTMFSLQQVTVVAGDRIDLIANKTIGDPLQFWRICDANNAMHPLELITPGNILQIPVPRG